MRSIVTGNATTMTKALQLSPRMPSHLTPI
jgi:hypothetical protein